MHWTNCGLNAQWFSTPEPPQKTILSENVIFGDLGFPSVILVNKSLKALRLSFKMVYQHLLYLLSLWTYWHLKISQGPTRFFIGNFRRCKMANLASGLKWAENARMLHNQLRTPKYGVLNWNMLGKFYPFLSPYFPKNKATEVKRGLKSLLARARSLWSKSRWMPYVWGWFWCIIVTGISSGVREISGDMKRPWFQVKFPIAFFAFGNWVISGWLYWPSESEYSLNVVGM